MPQAAFPSPPLCTDPQFQMWFHSPQQSGEGLSMGQQMSRPLQHAGRRWHPASSPPISSGGWMACSSKRELCHPPQLASVAAHGRMQWLCSNMGYPSWRPAGVGHLLVDPSRDSWPGWALIVAAPFLPVQTLKDPMYTALQDRDSGGFATGMQPASSDRCS